MPGATPRSHGVVAPSEGPGRRETLVSLATRPADIWLCARMMVWRLALPVMKRTLPLPRLVRLMHARGTERAHREDAQVRIARLAWLVYAVGSRPSRGSCLSRSLVVYRYLSAAGRSPQLVVGVRKEGDDVAGHAWVDVAGEPVHDTRATLAAFTPLLVFDSRGIIASSSGA